MNEEEYKQKMKASIDSIKKYAKVVLPSSSYFDDAIKSAKASNKKYTKQEIMSYLEAPAKNEEKLIQVVDYLVSISPQFQKLCNYLPNIALIRPVVVPNTLKYKTNNSKKKKDFLEACSLVEKLNIENASIEILRDVFRYGVYFGVLIEGQFSSYLKKLPIERCKIIGKGEAGLVYAFDFSYFDGTNNYLLDYGGYPEAFKNLYIAYKNRTNKIGNLEYKWQPLIPSKELFPICVKYDISNTDYSIPPLISVVGDIYDLDEYKSLNKAKTIRDNYSIIGIKIPTLNNGNVDDFAVSDDMVDATTAQLDQELPDYIGYAVFPGMDCNLMKASSPTDTTVDTVANATKNIFTSLGFADALFGLSNDTSASLKYSTKVDEQELFPIYRQIESFFNYRLKIKYKEKMTLKILNLSWYNITDVLGYYKDQVSLGSPLLTILPVILGFSQLEAYNMAEANIDIWDVFNTWKAPLSSYNSTTEDVGASTKKDEDVSEAGDRSRNSK